MHPMLRYYRFGALGIIGLLAQAAVPALAHPHAWVTARARIVYGADGLITAVWHTWTFDPAFSAFQAMGLNSKDLQDLAKSNAEALADSGYYTVLEANGIKQEFEALSSDAKRNTPGRFAIGLVDQDLRECWHARLFASAGWRKRSHSCAEGGWPFDRRYRQGGGAGQIHRVAGVAPKRLAQWPLFAAPRRRSLSTAQTA